MVMENRIERININDLNSAKEKFKNGRNGIGGEGKCL